jgi:LuxR family quorum sensing-dependent transcriptional regulator
MKFQTETLDVLAVIDEIESCDTIENALGAYRGFIEFYGFSSYLIGKMSNPASQTKNDVITNYSPEWIDRWVDENYVFHDPIFQYAMRTRQPFLWSTAYKQSSKMGKKVLNEGKEFDLNDGVAIPIATDFGPLGCISIATEHLEISTDHIPLIELVSIHFYQHLQTLNETSNPEIFGCLTKRETEVLHFVAEGKTNWEIGKILKLSEFSIKDHLRNLTVKLGAVNRAQAVAIAIRNGFIIP